MIPSVGPFRGGATAEMRTLARSLARAGVDVHVATTDDDGPARLNVPLGRPHREDETTYWYFRRQTSFYTMSWPLTRWLAASVRDYDVIHIHALFSYAAIPASAFARRHGVPYVVTPLGTLNRFGMEERRPLLKRLSYRVIERRILTGAARVHYTSEAERREAGMLGTVGRPAVIPHGIELDGFGKRARSGWIRRRAPQLAGRTTMLFLSRIDPTKGLDLLLPAFAEVKATHSDVALVIAGHGDPTFVGNLRAEAERLGIGNDVYWSGWLDEDDRLAALADADLFVLPSYSESFGLAVVEAMASGLPVVISDRVAIHREVGQAEAGLITRCDTAALAEALASLAGDADMRRRFGDGGCRLARDRFSADAMCAATIEMYHDVVQERARPRRPSFRHRNVSDTRDVTTERRCSEPLA